MTVTLPHDLDAWLDTNAQVLDTTAAGTELLPRLAGADLYRIGVPSHLGGAGGDAVTDCTVGACRCVGIPDNPAAVVVGGRDGHRIAA
ncbi:hypothetical protein, partial [Mycobacterium tuberculosis]|uniref:hypothetical protein n=1 Tax=Mycobacterium tuberculosis TaxID=1773 RepID=UPI001AE7B3A0|nr:hypothetical protein [Mycobacterium tuberculosis]